MNSRQFHNALRVPWNIDRWELEKTGAIAAGAAGDADWVAFRDDPHRFLARAPDAIYERCWKCIEYRLWLGAREDDPLDWPRRPTPAIAAVLSLGDSELDALWQLLAAAGDAPIDFPLHLSKRGAATHFLLNLALLHGDDWRSSAANMIAVLRRRAAARISGTGDGRAPEDPDAAEQHGS